MKPVKFEGNAYHEFCEWAKTDQKIFLKIDDIITDIDSNLHL